MYYPITYDLWFFFSSGPVAWLDARLPGIWMDWVQSFGPATFFHWDWSWNHLYSHSLPTPDTVEQLSDVHLVLVNCLGSLPKNSGVRLTDLLNMTIVVHWEVKPQIKQSFSYEFHLSCSTTKPTKWHVHLAKTQISLGISLTRIFSVHMKEVQVFCYTVPIKRTAKTLIRLGECPG